MEFGQVHHVEYYVNDIARTKDFWGWFLSKMNYSEYQSWESGISYEHKNRTYIVFVQVEPEHLNFQNNRQASGLNHIAFKGGSEADLKNLTNELRAKNIKILKEKTDYLCFEDPNNFAVEIFS